MKKRILSALLSLCMVLTLLPGALATDGDGASVVGNAQDMVAPAGIADGETPAEESAEQPPVEEEAPAVTIPEETENDIVGSGTNGEPKGIAEPEGNMTGSDEPVETQETGTPEPDESKLAVAQIGEETYPSLAAAIEAVQESSDPTTITLLQNAEGGVKFTDNKNIVLDMQGHALDVKTGVGSTGTETNGIQLLRGCTVVIKNGTIQTSVDLNFIIKNYCDLTLEGVTVDATNLSNDGVSAINNCGQLKLAGNGNVVKNVPDGSYGIATGNYHFNEPINTIIEGGDIQSVYTEGNAWTTSSYTYASKELIHTDIQGGKIGTVGIYRWAPEPELNWKFTISENATVENNEFAAKVGNDYYETVAGAIAAVTSSGTITLVSDTAEDVVIPADKAITLNLDGKTLTNKASHTISVQTGGTLSVTGNGTVDCVTHARAALYNMGTVEEISGGTFTRSREAGANGSGNGNSWYTVYNGGEIKKISGGTFENKGTYSSMLVNGWNNPGPKVSGVIGEISGGVFTGGVITIKNDDGGEIKKISGGSIQGTMTAIQNTSIIGEISGGMIKSEAVGIFNSGWKDKSTEYIGTVTVKNGAIISAPTAINNVNWGGSASTTEKFATTTIEGGDITGTLIDDGKGVSGCVIQVSGGYFTADPSAYLTDKKVAVASDKTGYAFMVAEAKVDNVAVAPAAPEIKPADTTGKSDEEKQAIGEAVEALKPAPGTSTVEVSQEAIKAAAGNVAASVTTEDAAKATESLKSEGVTVNPGDTVTIYVQPYLDIAVTDAKVGGSDITELSLDITPKAKLVASTATDAEGIVTDDAGKNAVVVDTQELALNTPVEITVPLPAAFSTGSELYVKHVKDNGKVYYYTATVAGDASKTATFTNPNGFSKFTLMATNEAAAAVGGVGYASFQEAVDAVANGGTIVAQKDITATVSGNKTFTVDANGHTVSLSAASGYTLTKSGDTYTVAKATDSGNEPTHSSSSGSSGSSNRTLTFVTNGGTAVKSVSKASGTVIDLSGYKTTRAGYTFEGWYSDSGLTEKVDTVKLTSNTKVYAKWSQDGVSADSVAGFTDVTSGDWYAAAVEYVTGKGMMNGTSTAKFAPEDKLTRGMIAQVLYNLEGKPAASGAAFTDVASTAWYADAVNWAASKSIVSGYGNNKFGPEDPITREQMAAILYRYAQYKAYDVTAKGELAGFTDRSAVSGYAAEALEWAVGAKLMNGKGNGVLDPAGNATRAEVAQILMNFSENVAK
ncbi:S-layer homology domain-containing protein [Intestinibacillus massiliensis]